MVIKVNKTNYVDFKNSDVADELATVDQAMKDAPFRTCIDIIEGASDVILDRRIDELLTLNPQYGSKAAALEAANQFFNAKLTTGQCQAIIGILGLPAVLGSMRDLENIESLYKAIAFQDNAIDKPKAMAGIKTRATDILKRAVLLDFDEDIESGNIEVAKDALLRIGYPEEHVKRMKFNGKLPSLYNPMDGKYYDVDIQDILVAFGLAEEDAPDAHV